MGVPFDKIPHCYVVTALFLTVMWDAWIFVWPACISACRHLWYEIWFIYWILFADLLFSDSYCVTLVQDCRDDDM